MEFSPPPRSCRLTKVPDFNGYGFTLRHNNGIPSIGTVDEKSPAAAAGLRKGDIIMEINGVNVTGENHHRIMGRIKASGNSIVFLVVDKELKSGQSGGNRECCCSLM